MTSKEKKRSSEKRKEKSRDAARCRRGKETEVFWDMAYELPLPSSVIAQLDKASIMRLTISTLRIHYVALDRHLQEETAEAVAGEPTFDPLYSKALEGFVFILSRDGDIVYISDNVIKYLGIQQIDLMGQSIYDFAHPCDHNEVKEVLSSQSHQNGIEKERRSFFLRMKCTLTSKGRSVNLKSASYKVIMCTGYLFVGLEDQENEAPGYKLNPYLLAIGEPIPDPANIEVPLDSNTFVSKHGLDMRFAYCDDRIADLIGYSSDELLGKSLFDYHHAEDSEMIRRAYKPLFEKGQMMTEEYRFLAKQGGVVRVITQATVIRNNRTQKPQWVVCVHYVLSAVEDKKTIMAVEQSLPVVPDDFLMPFIELSPDKIFAPKTKDMEQEFFIPPSLRGVFMDDNDSENLTYLAPCAGDANCDLEFPLLQEVLCKSEALTGTIKQERGASDGFKEEPEVLSRSLCRQSDECFSNSHSPISNRSRISSPQDYTAAASPQEVDTMNRFFSSLNTSQTGGKLESYSDTEMQTRAPYIPMETDQDFDLMPPSSESFFTLQNDFNPGVFGKTETIFTNKSCFEPSHRQKSMTMRDMIDGSPVVASIEQPPNTMTQQVKRPLDLNNLETGPPAAKVARVDNGCSQGVTSKDSVLLNLLLTGEDRNHGYKVQTPLSQHIHKGGPATSCQPSLPPHQLLLPRLSQQDCEVNAPSQSMHLLSGGDLLLALDASCVESARAGTRMHSPRC